MTSHLPAVTSTPAERLDALKEAKVLLFVPAAFSGGPFSATKVEGQMPSPDDLFRVAEYITTGHDYKDTHPTGKRRPVFKKVMNVTVMAGAGEGGPSPEDLEHLLSHMADGSFAQFMEDQLAEAAKSAGDQPETDDRDL